MNDYRPNTDEGELFGDVRIFRIYHICF